MNKIFLILLAKMLVSNLLVGCTCYQAESFDLQEYDESNIIIEAEILYKIDDDYHELVLQYQQDTANWDKLYPLAPLMPPKDFSDFAIKVEDIYKGQLNSNELILRAKEKFSSCYWEPQIGTKYIMYLGETMTEDKNEILQIFGACHRKISASSSNYNSEKKVLNFFKLKRNGGFKVNQKELISNNSTTNNLITIEGAFKNSRRHGVWKLRAPFYDLSNELISSNVILELRYEKGILVNIEQFKTEKKSLEMFLRSWILFYESKLNNSKE